MSQPLFGLVPAGLPVITQPTETPSQTSFIYSIPTTPKSFSHVVIFLLPGVVLPSNTAAAIYLVTPPDHTQGQELPNSKFLGGVGPGKESAIFKLNESSLPASSGGHIILGISIEEAGSVASRITELQAAKSSSTAASGSLALVPAGAAQARTQPSTLVLAQRIIKNAFNFLSSFSGQAGQVEVVPMKAFEDWWKKFESRVRSDPGFLERDD
jgi:protein Hikeshi